MKKLDLFLLPIIISFLFSCNQPNNEYTNHETNSKIRYEEMQKNLDAYVKNGDTGRIRLLSSQLETQLKLEDFLIRFRQVDSIKFTLSSPLISGILTALVSVITTLLTLFFKQRAAKSPPKVVTQVS